MWAELDEEAWAEASTPGVREDGRGRGDPSTSRDLPELLFVALCTSNQEGRPGRDFERARRCDDNEEAEVTDGPTPPFL